MKAISLYLIPTTVHEIRQFVGLASYLLSLLKILPSAKPLITLTKKDIPFQWNVEQEEAFQALKKKLIERYILQHTIKYRALKLVCILVGK